MTILANGCEVEKLHCISRHFMILKNHFLVKWKGNQDFGSTVFPLVWVSAWFMAFILYFFIREVPYLYRDLMSAILFWDNSRMRITKCLSVVHNDVVSGSHRFTQVSWLVHRWMCVHTGNPYAHFSQSESSFPCCYAKQQQLNLYFDWLKSWKPLQKPVTKV